MKKYDSLLIYAYGGPEKMEDVAPFLQSVAHGKPIPPSRLAAVEAHYALFNGRSPMNGAIRKFMTQWEKSVPEIPVYYGTRHTQPTLKNALETLIADGRKTSLVFTPTPFGGYLGTYFEKLAEVQKELEAEGKTCPKLDFIPPFSKNPRFLSVLERSVHETLEKLGDVATQKNAKLLFSVHSLPITVARQGGYETEARTAFSEISARFPENELFLVWQSASASPIPWLEPKITDEIPRIASVSEENGNFVLIPFGFPFENMEVVYDLDVEATQLAQNLNWHTHRVPTVAHYAEFQEMILEYF